MASINSQITLVDRMSSPLMNIISSVEQVTSSLYSVDSAINQGFNTSAINGANESLGRAHDEVQAMQGSMEENVYQQERFNDSANKGNSILKTMGSLVGAISVGYALKQAATLMYNSTTQLEATEAKFNTVFDGFTMLADTIADDFQTLTPATLSATRSMMSGIQDLLVPMGFAREEATAMTGDTMSLVGALTNFNSATHSAEDVSSAFSSALTGEYQSLKALGIQVSATTVQEKALQMALVSSTDEITSQIQATALLALAYEQSADALEAYNQASLDTTTKAGLLKSSFTDTFASVGQSLLPKINKMLELVSANMPTITSLVYAFGKAFGAVISVASASLGVVMAIAGYVVDHWSIIGPIVLGVAAAIGVYNAMLLANLAITKGGIAIKAAFGAIQTFLSIGYGVLSGSTAAASAAQFTYNSALLACPITWIILAIIALIAIFYTCVGAINHFSDQTLSATGIICGAFMVSVAVIRNLLTGIANYFISMGIEIYNYVAMFANFFANVFNDPVGAIIGLFSGMLDFIISSVQAAASLIDAVLKTDMASSLQNFRNDIVDKTAEIIGEQTVVMEKKVASDYHLDTVDYGDAYNQGYNFGAGLGDTISSAFDTSFDMGSTGYADNEMLQTMDEIAQSNSAIADSVSITSENLKYLLDKAEADAVNRFTTAEIKVEQTNHNNISSGMDIDGVIDKFTGGVSEALEKATEGVYA